MRVEQEALYLVKCCPHTKVLGLVNPIGPGDWNQEGAPLRSIDDRHRRELKVNVESMKKYELGAYDIGQGRED